MANFVETHGYDFHTFLTSAQKRKCFMIRGLSSDFGMDCDDIREELTRAGFPDEVTVLTHITGSMRAKQSPSLFKITVPGNFDERIFNSIRSINGVGIRFERFISGPVTQCSRCQFFFHTAAACHRPYRCVKCIENHEPGNCAKPAESEPQCVNCSGFHTANNYQKCDYFKDKIQPVINKRKSSSTDGNNIPNQPKSNIAKNPGPGKSGAVVGGSWAFLFKTKHTDAGRTRQRQSDGQSFEVLCGLLAQMVEGQNKIISKLFNNVN